ncbi:MAG: hypothetical protein J7K63_01245 [Candidatus Marinimicrobia bacterium]|nr:hypothetical protein [Candidatus Neomarinimicrobiota bacterium]
MKLIKRIVIFFSLFVLYIIFKEFLHLYTMLYSVHPAAAWVFMFVIAAFFIYFMLIPLFRILSIPAAYGPVYDPRQETRLIAKRMERFRKNKYLIHNGIDLSALKNDKESYNRIIREMEKGVDQLRRKHIPQLFYSTTIAQNGFLDSLLIISSSIHHIKEIFILYNGRVSNKDLLIILKKIYLAMAVGGSEAAEYATQEIFSRFATDGMKAIPFFNKVSASLIDGYVNAVMLTRISYITENYCKKTVIASDKELSPDPHFVFNSAKNITKDIRDKIFGALRRKAGEKLSKAITPVTDMFQKTLEWISPKEIDPDNQYALEIPSGYGNTSFRYGFQKLILSFKKKDLDKQDNMHATLDLNK